MSDPPSASWGVGSTVRLLEWFKLALSIPVYPMLQHTSGQVCLPWLRTSIFYLYIGDRADFGGPSALLATLHSQASSHLLGHGSPFEKLFTLSSATLARHAVDLDLHLSILLEGPRGIGKYTVASWVAQRLGMHLLEVIYIYI